MLTNYDARSVAEVMGIAFVRNTPASAERRAKSSSGKSLKDVVISVDETVFSVVQAGANDTSVSFSPPSGRVDRMVDVEDDLLSPPSPILIEKAVEQGLPRQALRNVAEWLAGGDKAKASALEWGVVPKTTLERRATQLSPQESERTERVARLFVHARRALGTEAEARDFMTMRHPQLEERSPVEAARTDLGARRTEQILNALEYGLAL